MLAKARQWLEDRKRQREDALIEAFESGRTAHLTLKQLLRARELHAAKRPERQIAEEQFGRSRPSPMAATIVAAPVGGADGAGC